MMLCDFLVFLLVNKVRRRRCMLCFFFFQAEDGIRDIGVTGVQTCALPISAEQEVAMRIELGVAPAALWLRRKAAGGSIRRHQPDHEGDRDLKVAGGREIGRASCGGREWILGVAASLKKKKII